MTSYQLNSDLSEKQIEADVAGYFGYMSPFFGGRLRLLDVDEQITGADKQHLTRGKVYYFQFKKPIGLQSAKNMPVPLKPRKNESTLMDVRRFRDQNGLDDYPYSLAFKLHANKVANINLLQHNVLYSLEKPSFSRAMYICPTTVEAKEYERSLSHPFWKRCWSTPFTKDRYQTVHGLAACSEIFLCPFLRGHISIIPHTTVASADHYYSFSKTGTDIAFHSPEIVTRDVARFSDFLNGELRRVILDPQDLKSLDEIASVISELSKSWFDHGLGEVDRDDPISWLQEFGKILMKTYSIRQFIVAVNENFHTQAEAVEFGRF